MKGIEIIDNGQTNPLIKVSPEIVLSWLRSLADQAGYGDRSSCAVQAKVTDVFEQSQILTGAPELVFMVSNIKGSRQPAPPPSHDGS